MALTRVVVPDGEKIRELMWDRGFPSVEAFARQMRIVKQADERWAEVTLLGRGSLYNVRSKNKRVSAGALRLMAATLGVEPEVIVLSLTRVPPKRKAA